VSVCGTVTTNLTLEVFLGNSAARLAPSCDFTFSQPLEIIDPDLPESFLEASNGQTIARSDLRIASLLRKLVVVLEY
jgi:hypothetical protein